MVRENIMVDVAAINERYDRKEGVTMEEEMITEEQAKRLVQWVEAHGHTTAEAHEALAYVMNATNGTPEDD
jgi:hypothetical protein